MANQQTGLSYGILADPLDKQLDKQKYKYDAEKVRVFELQRDAINTLRFGGLLTDSSVDKMLPKLHKKIVAHVAKANNKEVVKLKP